MTRVSSKRKEVLGMNIEETIGTLKLYVSPVSKVGPGVELQVELSTGSYKLGWRDTVNTDNPDVAKEFTISDETGTLHVRVKYRWHVNLVEYVLESPESEQVPGFPVPFIYDGDEPQVLMDGNVHYVITDSSRRKFEKLMKEAV